MSKVGSYKVGEVSWDEDDVPASRSSIPFLRMEFGKGYKMRIVSKPYRYYHHWTVTAQGGKTKVNCALENCPACGDEGPKLNRFMRALLKADNGVSEPAVLDVGPQIYKQLKELSKNPSWGSLHDYDIVIRKGKKGTNPLYTVQPEPKTALKEEDKKLAMKMNKAQLDGKDNPDYVDLEKLCQPWTIDRIKQALAGDGGAAATTPPQASDEDVFGDDEPAKSEKGEKSEKKEAKVKKSGDDDNDFLDL